MPIAKYSQEFRSPQQSEFSCRPRIYHDLGISVAIEVEVLAAFLAQSQLTI
jgi:hypothetical protein